MTVLCVLSKFDNFIRPLKQTGKLTLVNQSCVARFC